MKQRATSRAISATKQVSLAATLLSFSLAASIACDSESSDAGGGGAAGEAGTSGGATGQGSGGASSGGAASGGASSGGNNNGAFALPPVDAPFDYQLGGAYDPPSGVEIVARDRTESPAPGLYNICYVNGFQAQPNEEDFWLEEEPDLILRDEGGDPVIDEDWDEMLLDTSTPEKRARLGVIVGGWIAGCAADGFDAVEIDNLDSFSRSGDRLDEEGAVALIRLFADAAHDSGLAIAQKNSAELVGRRADMGTDFVVAEECNTWSECDVYTGAYDDHVLVIEYVQADFETGCAEFPGLSIVFRDVDLVTPDSETYVYDGC